MNRLLWLVAVLASSLTAAPAVAEQGNLPRYRQIASSSVSTYQQELNAEAANGYRVIAGNAARNFALLERVADGTKRSYVVASGVERFLKDKKLEPGYRLVGPLFAADDIWFSAVFERVGDDNQPYEYRVLSAGSPKDLRKKMESREPGFGLVALAIGSDAAAIYEAGATSVDSRLILGNGTEIQKQFASESTNCVIDSDGTKEAVYAVRPCLAAEAASGHEWLASTKTEELEKALNAAAARGLALVPSSLLGIAKTSRLMLGSAYAFETVCLVARFASTPASRSYRVIGTRRAGTFAQEMAAAAEEGFTVAGFAVGYQEIVAVMQK